MEKTLYESFAPLIQKSRGYEELKKDVIDIGLCSGCGACAAFCERVKLSESGSEPAGDCNLTKGAIKCNIDGLCYDVCPHISYNVPELDAEVFGRKREDAVLGSYIKIVAARAKDKNTLARAQDGGAVTALLHCLLESKVSDGAAVTKRDNAWSISSDVAKSREELSNASGTKYFRAMNVYQLGSSLKKAKKLAVVGTGCQIAGLRKIERKVLAKLPSTELTLLGLFCYENFPHSSFKAALEKEFGIKIEEAQKIDITKGKVKVWHKNSEVKEVPVKNFASITPTSCLLCRDFTATFSDISFGSIGSEDKWTTLIVRSEKGLKLLEEAEKKGYIEISDKADKEAIKKTASFKAKKREEVEKDRKEKGLRIPEYGY